MTATQTPTTDLTHLFDHAPFVELHADLLALLDVAAPENEIDAKLAALEQHLRQQFAAEEQGMLAAQFGPLESHKKDHDQALGRLAARIAQWHEERDRGELQAYMEGGFADWFVRHVNTRDFITAQRLSLGV